MDSLEKTLKDMIKTIDTKHYDTDFADGRKQQAVETLEGLGVVAQKIREKRKHNNCGIVECEKTLKQEHYNSMTKEQRNAQAYAVFCALEGIYKEILGLLVEEGEK